MTAVVAFEDRSATVLAWKVGEWFKHHHSEMFTLSTMFTTTTQPHPEYNFPEVWHYAFVTYSTIDDTLSPSEKGEVVGEEE